MLHLTRLIFPFLEGTFRFGHFQCSVIKLDDYVRDRNISKVDVIKMDIEGAELQGFEGMKYILETYKPFFLMEVNLICCKAYGLLSVRLTQISCRFWVYVSENRSYSRIKPNAKQFDKFEQFNILAHATTLPDALCKDLSIKKVLRRFGKRNKNIA